MIVEWTESAWDRLADMVTDSDLAEQDRIEAAVLRINAALAADPSELGESRAGPWRIWFAEQMMVRFRIVPTEGRVVVAHVARSRRKG